ncbi:patatin-like phospholipase family protein [Spiribacter halobius]|uniref:patatin-like phospholipase family protein n=1 Tax=Sediminicurvatus halobius TaxID=2182432 RepID=UPI001E3EEA4B|nr:patatin-like phospholipase family protein [Spiribacter halobius]UEX78647.1 patatin-like phospholipase family protein [Spiribacter halobius]
MAASGLLAGDQSPALVMLRTVSRMASPYQLNPGGFNALAGVLADSVDFDALRHPSAPRLFVSATSVHSGRLRLFGNRDVTSEALQASACLPMLFQAVAIDGEYYWDGGYSSNPPLLPLLRAGGSRDLMLVQLKESWSETVPTTAEEITLRASDLTFNAGLLRELELCAELRPWLARRTRLHRISADDAFTGFGQASSMNADWGFLTQLHARGRDRADAWLANHRHALGRHATLPWTDFRVPGLGG